MDEARRDSLRATRAVAEKLSLTYALRAVDGANELAHTLESVARDIRHAAVSFDLRGDDFDVFNEVVDAGIDRLLASIHLTRRQIVLSSWHKAQRDLADVKARLEEAGEEAMP